MKKLLYIVAMAVVMLATACSKSEDFASEHEGKGAVSFSFLGTRAEETDSRLSLMKFRVYSHDAEGEKTLVRLYTYDEIKDMKMWLVAGDYSISVEGGVKAPASFTDVYYHGASEFSLAAGEEKTVSVEVHPKRSFLMKVSQRR